jgi:hypothetical protein
LIEWNATDAEKVAAFSILFSQNHTEIDAFLEFAREQHQTRAVIAVNPPLPRKLLQTLQLSLSRTVLVADGRLFESFSLQLLRVICRWTARMIYGELESTMDSRGHKRSTAIFCVSCILDDWHGELIARRAIREEIWDTASPLLHDAQREMMHCDLIVDRFTREYQRIATAQPTSP